MPGNAFGQAFRYTTWGESHGPAIGCVLDGVPPRIPLEEADIQFWLDHRRPGQSKYTTQRKEPDRSRILSGVFEGVTTGTPIALVIENEDQVREEEQWVAPSVQGFAIAASTSIVATLLRGSSLLAMALSSVPLWKRMDPLMILSLSHDERSALASTQRDAEDAERDLDRVLENGVRSASLPADDEFEEGASA